jgi:hypothetical protein
MYNYHAIRTTTTPSGYVTEVVVYLTTMLSVRRGPDSMVVRYTTTSVT